MQYPLEKRLSAFSYINVLTVEGESTNDTYGMNVNLTKSSYTFSKKKDLTEI